MFEIIYFVNNNGVSPLKKYINGLAKKSQKSKNTRIRFNKIGSYINILRTSIM
jgi:hypothetical protein